VTTVSSREINIDSFDASVEGVSAMEDLKPLLVAKKPNFIICSVTHRYVNSESEISRFVQATFQNTRP